MPDPSEMSQEELDIWSDINNPNNDADMDDLYRPVLLFECLPT
ncbi:hypothetical protein [Vibrio cincinnatiensis]|nr:hypothetical protein [Vibrio cincinnatiensis]